MYVKLADVETVIYARQSRDRTGEELGVSRQLEDARALAKVRGWTVVDELVDNDISAAGKSRRPDFEAALQAAQEGRARCILAWDMTRLTRNARDRLRLLEIGKKHGITVAFVRGSDLDLGTPAGRLTADILGSVAQHEIEQKSDRQKRAAVQAAEQGRRTGGRRPFGYEADGMTIRETEATAVRTAYEAVLFGVPLGRIATDWNARGLHTPQRGYEHGCAGTCAANIRPRDCPKHRLGDYSTWSAQTIRPLLLNPRYAGLMSHMSEERREAGGDPRLARLDAIVGAAAWPALVGEEIWRAAVELLTDPTRRKASRSGRALLTGVGLCGVCGATVHSGGGPKRNDLEAYGTYRCRDAFGHVGRAAGPVDWWISELVIERLSRPDAIVLLDAKDRPDAATLRSEARALRVRLDGLAKLLADGVLTEMGVRRESARLRDQLAAVEEKLRDSGRVNVLGPLIGAAPGPAGRDRKVAVRSAWEGLDVDRRRAAVEELMIVRLKPPGRGTRFGRNVESWTRNVAQIEDSIEMDWRI